MKQWIEACTKNNVKDNYMKMMKVKLLLVLKL